MAETKPYVRIQSSKTIKVTAGLQLQDVTNKDAHVADRLKVNPLWPKTTVLIREGAGIYPSEIATWPTVKALQKDGILTIGDYLDTASEEEQKVKTDLQNATKEIAARTEQAKSEMKSDVKAQSLADIAK